MSLNVRWNEVIHQAHGDWSLFNDGNAFVLRSNRIVTRTLLKQKRQMEKRQKKPGSVSDLKRKPQNGSDVEKQNLGTKSSKRNVFYKWHKNLLERFQFCMAKE